ncbi:MAG: SUMF1/EgtB/PvdO family nonheme iron enzyme [Proteobacteria bacterium]|nr:SUMF1/EgtB/PvdO family nonheme iron enzyme [Pseudomonadota bacterium]
MKIITASYLVLLLLLSFSARELFGQTAVIKGNPRVAPPVNAAPKIEETVYPPGATGVPLILIPAGEFMMGCKGAGFNQNRNNQQQDRRDNLDPGYADRQCQEDENPYHRVWLDAYYIDKFEVTLDHYARCARAGKCPEPGKVGYCNWGQPGKGDHPVNCVDWNQAGAYCEWTGKRLPTEAEWEKAARGTEGRIYPWGNEFDCHRGNFDDEKDRDPELIPGGPDCDGYKTTAPVGRFSAGASPYGVMDMAGNVWEWVSDWYGDNYYRDTTSRNPSGPAGGTVRSLRGGGWYSNATFLLRTSRRGWADPNYQGDHYGFRCARDAR